MSAVAYNKVQIVDSNGNSVAYEKVIIVNSDGVNATVIDIGNLPVGDPHVLNELYRSGDFIAISNG